MLATFGDTWLFEWVLPFGILLIGVGNEMKVQVITVVMAERRLLRWYRGQHASALR